MSRKKKPIGAQRNFLNELYMTSLSSHISYKVELDTWNDELYKQGLYDEAVIAFNLADCNKHISLDFDIRTKKETKNSLYKIGVIVSTLEAMKQDILTARQEVKKGKRRLVQMAKEEARKDKKAARKEKQKKAKKDGETNRSTN